MSAELETSAVTGGAGVRVQAAGPVRGGHRPLARRLHDAEPERLGPGADGDGLPGDQQLAGGKIADAGLALPGRARTGRAGTGRARTGRGPGWTQFDRAQLEADVAEFRPRPRLGGAGPDEPI